MTDGPFRPEDFNATSIKVTRPELYKELLGEPIYHNEGFAKVAARLANARYREILEKEGVRVWGSVSDETGMELFGCWDEKQTRKNYSHTGIVVAIEEIKRAECDRLLEETHES